MTATLLTFPGASNRLYVVSSRSLILTEFISSAVIFKLKFSVAVLHGSTPVLMIR